MPRRLRVIGLVATLALAVLWLGGTSGTLRAPAATASPPGGRLPTVSVTVEGLPATATPVRVSQAAPAQATSAPTQLPVPATPASVPMGTPAQACQRPSPASIQTLAAGPSQPLTWTGGTPGASFDVQTSSDLLQWVSVATLAFDSSGHASFTPTQTAYYRQYAAATGQCSIPVRVVVPVPPAPVPTPPPAIKPPLCASASCTWTSADWSGYVVGDGPFSAVAGTFTVPNLRVSAATTSFVEWVGIGGINTASLIQAGVRETTVPNTGLVTYQAWWETLPDHPAVMPIDWSQVSVKPGDTVTVAIGKFSGTTSWAIMLTDDTTRQGFTTIQQYTGPQAPAEWIVEAPTDVAAGITYRLGEYTPDVIFTRLRVNGSDRSTTEALMAQDGMTVSTPSALTADGFKVAYGNVPPAAP
jgi:Peptidase A4 family